MQHSDTTMAPGDVNEDLKYSLMMLGETRKWAAQFREKLSTLTGKISPIDLMCEWRNCSYD